MIKFRADNAKDDNRKSRTQESFNTLHLNTHNALKQKEQMGNN